jgi:HEAT repeat protein
VDTAPRPTLRSRSDGTHDEQDSGTSAQQSSAWVYATGWRAEWVSAIGNWPANEHTWSMLRRALNDEEANVQRAAAQAIARVFRGATKIGELWRISSTKKKRGTARYSVQ